MKRIQPFLVTLVTIFLFAACKQDNSVKNSKEDILKAFDAVGKYHNETLEYFYNSFERDKKVLKDNNLSLEGKLSYVSDILLREDAENPVFKLSNTSSGEKLHYLIYQQIKFSVENFKQALLSGSQKSLAEITVENTNLSQEERGYYAELNQIVANYSTILEVLEREVNQFNEKVISHFGNTANSTYILLSASYTAIYSAKYWHINRAKWQALRAEISDINRSENVDAECCGGIVAADVSGAAGGAASGAILGAVGASFTIPGVGTVVGAAGGAIVGAVTGGVGHSVTQAISNLIDWLF